MTQHTSYGPVHGPPTGEMSRRGFMRRMLGVGVGLLSLEFIGGTHRLPVAEPDRGSRRRDHARHAQTTSTPSGRRGRTGVPVHLQPGQPVLRQRPGRARRASRATERSPSRSPIPGRTSIRGAAAARIARCWRCTASARTSAARSRSCASQSQWFECLCHGSKYTHPRREARRPRAARHGPLRGHRHRWRLRRRHQPRSSPGRPAGHDHVRRPRGDRHAALHRLTDAAEGARRPARHGARRIHDALLVHRRSRAGTRSACDQEEELLALGEIVFSDDPTEPIAAGCARCHGADGDGRGDPERPRWSPGADASTPPPWRTSCGSTRTTSTSPSATAASSSPAT